MDSAKQATPALHQIKSAPLSEIALFALTLLIWCDRILLTYVHAVLIRVPLIGGAADLIISAVYLVLILLALPQIFKKLKLADLFFGVAVLLVCLFHFIIFPENTAIFKENFPTLLLFTFSLYFIGVTLDFEKIYPWLYKLSLITIVAFTLYKLFVGEPMDEIQSTYEGDMWGAYNFLPHVCLVAIRMLKKPNPLNVTLSVVGIAMLAFLGSRGPLLCVILAIASYLILFKKYKRPFLAYFLIITAAITLLIFLEPIMQFLYELSADLGLSIRVFDKYFGGEISSSTSRERIIEKLQVMISDNPIIGHGLYGDRAAIGIYAHNIAIELWHAFGVILGTAVLGGIMIVLLRGALITKKQKDYALLFLPLFFSGFIKLFLSGSILDEIYLFLLLGLAVSMIRARKKTVRIPKNATKGEIPYANRPDQHADQGEHGQDHASDRQNGEGI